MTENFSLNFIDYAIMAIYFAFVLGIGWLLKKYMKSSAQFLEGGKSIPAWITGLAFISANLGALEVFGMGASGAKYGMLTCHFYLIGAIPGMIFLGIFMMPFYYGSKARSVPEYLKFRFDEKTRGFNAFAFAIMTVFASGISMFALARLMEVLLHWNFHVSLIASAVIVLIYTYLGGLKSAIYNEVLQFFLIVAGMLPLVIIGLNDVGGYSGLKESLGLVAGAKGFEPDTWLHTWKYLGKPESNPLGVDWLGMFMGLGFVLGFGYWCTNFLVVQRGMAANSMSAARRTPLIGALPKMFIPLIVVVPGMIAAAVMMMPDKNFQLIGGDPNDFNMIIPSMLVHYYPNGLLGLGITALMASFMSGMAGNVTAFNTVFTYDIYQSYINKGKSDQHYLHVGQFATVFGVAVSILTAYVAASFNNIMDFLQLIFAFVNGPLFAVFLIGMFWKRATGHGAFWGLISGTVAASLHHGLTLAEGKGAWIANIHEYYSSMAQSYWTAIFAFSVCFLVTVIISLFTRQQKTREDLTGLVYSLTPRIKDEPGIPWYEKPVVLAIVVGAISIVLTIILW
ncbi:MAG TPA: sodium:solute symporter family protein [Bacteroidales bacterium]|nr:sodium:solute symporter family protein [Bacteroidales bacterium]HPT02320.1 sodium:solute symporter family protein [Bacteroidales bacterium]